jgi:hypothetical protein
VNYKRSEELFKMVLERVTKVQASKKKFLFVTLIGLVRKSVFFVSLCSLTSAVAD